MKALIIYDSLYGNTEKIARALGGGIGGDVKVVKVGDAKAGAAELSGYDLLLIGSPTQGGRYTKAMGEFLGKITAEAVKGKSAAAFDTRIKTKIVKLFGYAAGRIVADLKKKGAAVIGPEGAFFVNSAKGPLAEGELERAAAWAKGIAAGKQPAADPNAGRLDIP